jgi:hypothetical protein
VPLLCGHFLLHGVGDRIDGLQDFFGGSGVGDFDAEIFVETDHELQGIDGIEAEAAGAKEREVVTDFGGCYLQHEVFNHHCFDAFFQSCCVFHFS